MKAVFSLLVAITSGGEVRSLRKQCLPCIAFGYRYCADDDNLVNLNGNKCYEFPSDKQEHCADFDFYSNRILCEEEEFTNSKACDMFLPQNMDYYTVQQVSVHLEPRSTCGFFLYEYSAWLDITHQYPMTVYHSEYKKVAYSDVEFMVTISDADGPFPNNDCFLDTCNNYYYVTYGK